VSDYIPMDVPKLQTTLGVVADGRFGTISGTALESHFTNLHAAPVDDCSLQTFASRLGCSVTQIKAVAQVESSGSGFDKKGRPKILFERHLFHRATDSKWSPSMFSQSGGGGYDVDSWAKLKAACAVAPDVAFESCSWGKFQVLGLHWERLKYASPYHLAVSTVESEAAHFELLARYVEAFGLVDELRALSANPDDCRPFAKGYNGPAYEKFSYHTKLASAMQ
jgi:hypothetical protein